MFGMNAAILRFVVFGLLLAALACTGCSTKAYRVADEPQATVESRSLTAESGDIQIRTSVPSREEAEQLFGLPLQDRGIQAVWLEVINRGALRARFVPYSVDPEYFPPHEVAYMFRKRFSRDSLDAIETRLLSLSMPRTIPANSTASGYVFTHEAPGTKAFNVDIYYADAASPNEHFTFFVDVPGFTPDHASVDFAGLYAPEAVRDYDVESFRNALAEWSCCTSNHDGIENGRPWNIAFVAHGRDLLRALLRADWQETSLNKDPNYLLNIDYLFNRPPDARFRQLREEGSNRNEIALWLAPARVEGSPVWLGRIDHAISRFFGLGDYFLGARIDPNADEGRNFLLQNMWYSQSLEAFAFSNTGVEVSPDTPRLDFNGQPWFADGYRLVLWISGEPVPLSSIQDMQWDPVVDARRDSP